MLKRIKILTLTFVIFLLIITPNVSFEVTAQGFSKGKLYLFGNGSLGFGNNSGSLEKKLEFYNYPTNLVLNNTNPTSLFLIYHFTNRIANDQTILSSNSKEIGVEYGLFKYFGLGLAVSDQSIVTTREKKIDPNFQTFITLNSNDQTNLTSTLFQLSYLDFISQSRGTIFQAATLDLNLFFHPLSQNSFDPYIKIGGGAGRERQFGGSVNRLFGGIGLRYHINDRFFVYSEIEHANTYIVNYKAPTSGYRNYGNYEETSVKLGAGVSFLSSNNSSPNETNETTFKQIESKDFKSKVTEDKIIFLASEIFDLPSLAIHAEGKARLDAIVRKLQNEYKNHDVIIITYTTPFKMGRDGVFENYDLGFERSVTIASVIREKGISPKRILNSTYGSVFYQSDSLERVVFEFRQK
ncbi:hypothetical protein P3G55_00030 [Leptospira sp. 96542]|nr:hypothetical protein [Leptospira sp. 96542]